MANSDGNLNPHVYTMNGVEVSFPVKAYPSQVAMMSKIIMALQRSQNSLLESPTGSGKSLALLCAALAWQKKETQLAKAYNMAVEQRVIEPEEEAPGAKGPEEAANDDSQEGADGDVNNAGGFIRPDGDREDDKDDDFVEDGPPRNFQVRNIPFPGGEGPATGALPANGENKPPVKFKKKTVPKIYFGTRTHKQITQIVRELKKTAYKDTRMTIPASREHTCINKTVLKMSNKTEGCRDLTDKAKGGGCPFQSNVKNKMSNHHSVSSYRGTSDAWDLEDIVKLGKKIRACPYYGTRELKNTSQIVFCPYNYLVEPLIRKSMEINLKGQIVILDEAHNIEDSARSAASWQAAQEELQAAVQDLERVVASGIGEPECHRELASSCSKLALWIDGFKNQLTDYSDFNSASKVWTGTEAVALFQLAGFGPERYGVMRNNLEKVLTEWQSQIGTEEENDGMEHNNSPKLKTPTVDVIENFALVLGHLYLKDQRYRDDFRVALVRTQSRKQNPRAGGAPGDWTGKGGAASVLGLTYTVNFWCLNPAVTFDELKESVRSIVLTSGTLSPMASFSSELDVRFPIQLEANHVIDKKQVWIGTLSHGPTGHCLNATFKNAESFGFQDELGRVALNVCQTVAHGVLLFLPSYRMLQNLTERWQRTGVWANILEKKVIICEPKNSAEFESSIRHFYEVIESTSNGAVGDSTVDGSLFIAVCRGKVSEGLDFADNNARAVICVGIPFPNVKDIQVDLKMRYNDVRRSKPGQKDILSGKEWYEIQAFRALNQALGRCIRHRRDWGAIIMVDDRFAMISRYLNSLSKWVRSGVVHFNNHSNMLTQLAGFNQSMVKLDEEYKFKQKEIQLLESQVNSEVTKDVPVKNPEVKSEMKVNATIAQKLASKMEHSSAQAVAEMRNSQYQKVFSIFEKSKTSVEKVASKSKASKRNAPCQDVTSSVMNRCDVPEVITVPESPTDSRESCPSPVCIPESPDKCCSGPVSFEGKRRKMSSGEKENESGCSTPPTSPTLNSSSASSTSATAAVAATASVAAKAATAATSLSRSNKRKRLMYPAPKTPKIQFEYSDDDDFK